MYTAYCTFFVCGTILAMQIRFIGFNHVQSSEHLAFILTFIGLNVRVVGLYPDVMMTLYDGFV